MSWLGYEKHSFYRFNRYMVECEFLTPQSFGEEQLVLIDTWWNVNRITAKKKRARTYSFNRYMVECELFYCHIRHHITPGFNRYMVECELCIYMSYFCPYAVLIDTWWNVNYGMVNVPESFLQF